MLSLLPVVPLVFALLLESPLEPEFDLLPALSPDALALFELLSELPALDGALPFPLLPLALFSLAGEAESEPPESPEPLSEFPDPFDPFDGPNEPGAEWLWA